MLIGLLAIILGLIIVGLGALLVLGAVFASKTPAFYNIISFFLGRWSK